MAVTLWKKMRSEFEHQQSGMDYSHLADIPGGLMLDADMWGALEIGDYFEIPWNYITDRNILWEIDHSSFNHDFVLVKHDGKRFIERIDK